MNFTKNVIIDILEKIKRIVFSLNINYNDIMDFYLEIEDKNNAYTYLNLNGQNSKYDRFDINNNLIYLEYLKENKISRHHNHSIDKNSYQTLQHILQSKTVSYSLYCIFKYDVINLDILKDEILFDYKSLIICNNRIKRHYLNKVNTLEFKTLYNDYGYNSDDNKMQISKFIKSIYEPHMNIPYIFFKTGNSIELSYEINIIIDKPTYLNDKIIEMPELEFIQLNNKKDNIIKKILKNIKNFFFF